MTDPNLPVLVLNAGSSSIKAALGMGRDGIVSGHADIRGEETTLSLTSTSGETQREPLRPHTCESHGDDPWQQALAMLLDRLLEHAPSTGIAAVGHRIVHGGRHYAEPTRITPDVLETLVSLTPLAPLHQPQGVAGIRQAMLRLPDALQVACFDTAFHRTCPIVARRFALPRRYEEAGIERYGFHGLSYESIVRQLPGVTGGLPHRAVIAHLGAGASMAAVLDGRSVATTMGFTPLDGLVMATRCGSLDPGVVLHLAGHEGLSPAAIETMLSRESGLMGVSGITGDMRRLLTSESTTAAEAIDLFCYRATREIGSLAAAVGGLDAVVFTAGIGEHAAAIRARICQPLAWLGIALDEAANASHGPRISRPESGVTVWVLATDEESVIADATRRTWATWSGQGRPRPRE